MYFSFKNYIYYNFVLYAHTHIYIDSKIIKKKYIKKIKHQQLNTYTSNFYSVIG